MRPHGRVIAGLGNRFRGDDAAGLELAARIRPRVPDGVAVLAVEGDPTPLIDVFDTAELVLVADAVAARARPGTILRFDASDEPVPGAVFGASTHAFGLGETIELARALGRLNARVFVYGIAGADFSSTDVLTPAVAGALDTAAEQLLADLTLPGRPLPPAATAPHYEKEATHA